MTLIDIPRPSQVVPVYESNLFEKHESAKYAVGIIARGDAVTPGMDDDYEAYLRLRGNVYAMQEGMIDPAHVAEDGTERDENDHRSVHIAIAERTVDDQQLLIGAMRIIVKTDESPGPLPVESFFEDFQEPAPVGVNELSRFICRHEDSRLQMLLKWPLYRRVVAHAIDADLDQTFAVIEPPLARIFDRDGMPTRAVTAPKYIAEYNDVNLGIAIDMRALADRFDLQPEPARDDVSYFASRSDLIKGAAL